MRMSEDKIQKRRGNPAVYFFIKTPVQTTSLILFSGLRKPSPPDVETTVLPDSDNIKTVYQNIHDGCHDKGGEHIKDRVLLDEHGGQNDGDAQSQRAHMNRPVPAQQRIPDHCKMSAK